MCTGTVLILIYTYIASRLPHLVFGIGLLAIAVDGAIVGDAEVFEVVASDDASAKATTSTCLTVVASLAFSCPNLACMVFAFARAAHTITWQPLSVHALQIGSTTE